MSVIRYLQTHIDDTKDQAVLGAHGEVATVGISGNWGRNRGIHEKFVHLRDAANLVGSSIHGEHEHKDDSEEHRSMRAVGWSVPGMITPVR